MQKHRKNALNVRYKMDEYEAVAPRDSELVLCTDRATGQRLYLASEFVITDLTSGVVLIRPERCTFESLVRLDREFEVTMSNGGEQTCPTQES